MLLYCTVLVCSAVKSSVGANTIPVKEYLNGGSGYAHVYLLFYVFIRHRVVHPVHRNMVIGGNGSNLPCCQFKRSGWQGTQERSFFYETTGSAAFPLLKGLVIESSSRSWIASFSSAKDRNCRFRKAARIKVEMMPTVPSTAALSLGERTLSSKIAVP